MRSVIDNQKVFPVLDVNQVFLLTIDIQERLLPAMYNKEQLNRGLRRIIQGAELFAIEGCVSEQYPKGLGATVGEYAETLQRMSHPFFEKTKFNALTPEIKDYIEKSEKKQILIIGVETHVCVYQTVRELLMSGYEVFIIADAVSSRFEEDKKFALKTLRQLGAWIISSENALFDLLGDAKHPNFKAISNLVKE